MAHFAKLDSNNEVIEVVVVANGVLGSPESEAAGITFLTNITGHSNWKQCSYNKNMRKNFPGRGHFYDSTNDLFYRPKPNPSHTLNTTTGQWDPPIVKPSGYWLWDESEWKKDNTKGWVQDTSYNADGTASHA